MGFVSSLPLLVCSQVPRVDVEAVKGEVLRVSNRSCESVALVGNTLECTVPSELQAATRELEVEVREARHGPPVRAAFAQPWFQSEILPRYLSFPSGLLHSCLMNPEDGADKTACISSPGTRAALIKPHRNPVRENARLRLNSITAWTLI